MIIISRYIILLIIYFSVSYYSLTLIYGPALVEC